LSVVGKPWHLTGNKDLKFMQRNLVPCAIPTLLVGAASVNAAQYRREVWENISMIGNERTVNPSGDGQIQPG
jgi:hypothetical protein